MFADLESLKTALLTTEPNEFVSHYLFEPIPFLFKSDLSAWIKWKTTLARAIGVDPYDIVLTGSSAIGFSLNPRKNYKPFDGTSDIDCGVISRHHFDLAWRHLRQLGPSWLSLDRSAKNAIISHRKSYVFSGTIATDAILGLLPFGGEWQAALDSMSATEPTVGREVKLRIYQDYEALRQYQTFGISRLRENLAVTTDSTDAEEEEIHTED